LVDKRTSSSINEQTGWFRQIVATFYFLAFSLICACTFPAERRSPHVSDELIIFHAGSLTFPVDKLSTAFEELYPGVEILSEAAGSRITARKVSELGREADIVMSADYQVINTLLIPEYAMWNIQFATNSMVIVYSDHSTYSGEVNPENWYEILTRDGVVVGRSNPHADPNGYRTLLVWQLAESHYGHPGLYDSFLAASPEENIRPKEVDLIPLIQTGEMDYAFSYHSIALQHDLAYIDLPPEIDLSDPSYEEFYSLATVELDGHTPGAVILRQGEPIIYGVTIPNNAPNPDLAVQFLQFLFSPDGREILSNQGQIPFIPPVAEGFDNLGTNLQQLVEPAH